MEKASPNLRSNSSNKLNKKYIKNSSKKEKITKLQKKDMSRTMNKYNRSPIKRIKHPKHSLKKLAKTQENMRKDYMNVFLLAKEIHSKNVFHDNTNFRKNLIDKEKNIDGKNQPSSKTIFFINQKSKRES